MAAPLAKAVPSTLVPLPTVTTLALKGSPGTKPVTLAASSSWLFLLVRSVVAATRVLVEALTSPGTIVSTSLTA